MHLQGDRGFLMASRARTVRLIGLLLVALGAVLLGLGLNAVLNPSCRNAVYLCPKAGCPPTPCPSSTDYVWGAEWGVPGGAVLVAGVMLYRKAHAG